jgi:hypothetical protein
VLWLFQLSGYLIRWMRHLQSEIHVQIKDTNFFKKSISDSSCSYYFHSHIFRPELPFSSTSYSNNPTRLSRHASLPIVVVDEEDDDLRQNTEPTSLLFSLE